MENGSLFIAPPGARNRRDNIFRALSDLCPGNDFSPVTYLASNVSVLSAVRGEFFSFLKSSGPPPAYIPFQAVTIRLLAEHRYGMSSTHTIISDRIRTLILCSLVKDTNIGYAQLLSDFYRKIRHYVLDRPLEMVQDDICRVISEEKTKDRAVRAMSVLREYETFLENNGLIDADDVLRESVHSMQESGGLSSELQTLDSKLLSTLVIDGFFDPTPLEFRIIELLIEQSDNVLLLAEEDSEMLKSVRPWFAHQKVRTLNAAMRRSTSAFCTYPSLEDEVEGIARNVKRRIINGMKPWEITICFPSLPRYLPMLQRIFARHSIPISMSEHDPVRMKAISALHDIMACLENDYPRNDLLSVITSPCFVNIPPLLKEQAVACAYRAGIIRGRQAWLTMQDVIARTIDRGSAGDELQRIKKVQTGVRHVIAALDAISKARDLASFSEAFESALTELGLYDCLAAASNGSTRDTSSLIEHIFSELRQFSSICTSGWTHASPVFYLRYLLQNVSVPAEPADTVRILPYELAAGIESTALFFGGLTEGSFPYRPAIDPLLPERVKKELGLPDLEYYLHRQQLYFRRLMHASSLEPFLSCPSADGDTIFLPSPFLDWDRAVPPDETGIWDEADVLVQEGATGLLQQMPDIETVSLDRASLDILRRRTGFMRDGYFRVTDIDFYRKCPLRFYIERILGLEVSAPPRFEVEYRLWGSLAHRTMELLFAGPVWPIEEIEERLFSCLDKSLREFQIADFWADVAGEIFRLLAPFFKEREQEIRKRGFLPFSIEETLQAEIEGIKLKGKIDRIDKKSQKSEVRSQGSGDSVILLDYKTGSIDGKSLQLPLYAALWQAHHPEPPEAAGYYSLKDGSIQWYPRKSSMDEFIRDAVQEAAQLVENIKTGRFPAEPFDAGECRYCGHKPVCQDSQ